MKTVRQSLDKWYLKTTKTENILKTLVPSKVKGLGTVQDYKNDGMIQTGISDQLGSDKRQRTGGGIKL